MVVYPRLETEDPDTHGKKHQEFLREVGPPESREQVTSPFHATRHESALPCPSTDIFHVTSSAYGRQGSAHSSVDGWMVPSTRGAFYPRRPFHVVGELELGKNISDDFWN